MSFFVTAIIFSILIVIHEFGHFIAARRAGIKVEKFAIGFGPPLLKIKGKNTDFLICLIPLGGYVKMAGDVRSECKGSSDEFLTQPVGVKMRVVFAGPLFNYLLALVIFCIVAFIGFPYRMPVVGKVLDGYPAQAAGLKEGDRILEVNDKKVNTWDDMAKLIYASKDQVNLKIEREGREFLVNVSLSKEEVIDDFGRKRKASIVGIGASSDIAIEKHGFPQCLVKGASALFDLTFLIIKGFVFIILGVIPIREAIGGPIAIYSITSDAVRVGLIPVLQIMAALNVTLAIINLFPVPILDGGHLLFFLIEKIRKKPLSDRTEDIFARIGLTLIGLLVAFVLYNDSIKYGPRIMNKIMFWRSSGNSDSEIIDIEDK